MIRADHCPHCGVEIEAKPLRKPRSVPQHRRYFALIRAAMMHWPEAHRFRPASEEHLRKWLQARAGYRDVRMVDTAGMTAAQAVGAIAALIHRAGEHHFVHAKGDCFYVITSKSIAFDELPHQAACALFDHVAEVIEAETGIRCDDMIRTTPSKSTREPAVDGVSM